MIKTKQLFHTSLMLTSETPAISHRVFESVCFTAVLKHIKNII